MIYVIIACEIGFWVILGIGFALRYIFKLKKTSAVVLGSVILVDIILITAAVIHVRSGATATLGNAMAPYYLGFSVMWGHRTVKWFDRYIQHKLTGAPHPRDFVPVEKNARRIYHLKGTLRDVCAFTIIIATSWACIYLGGGVNDATMAFYLGAQNAPRLGFIVLLFDFSYVIWPGKPKKNKRHLQHTAPANSFFAIGDKSMLVKRTTRQHGESDDLLACELWE